MVEILPEDQRNVQALHHRLLVGEGEVSADGDAGLGHQGFGANCRTK